MAETFFQSLFTSIADSGRELIARNLTRSERSGADRVIELCRALLSSRGEASGAALAVATLEAYDALPKDQQATLFQRLVVEFCSDQAAVLAAARAYEESPT
ncbi:MAG: MCD, Malonyl-CoA decarboxylase MCD, partial [Pseudomonadota bacterium]